MTFKIKVNKDFVWSQVDDEIVMMDAHLGKYFGIDSVGTRIWKLLQEEVTFENLKKKICHEYEVSAEQCDSDLKVFLKKLEKNKLISIDSHAS